MIFILILISTPLALLFCVVLPIARVLLFTFIFVYFIYLISPHPDLSKYKQKEEMTLEELEAYPYNCKDKDSQLKELLDLQKRKNFDSNPDNLELYDRAYNGRLKATIWWYAYRCEE